MPLTSHPKWNRIHLDEPKVLASIPRSKLNPNKLPEQISFNKLSKCLSILQRKELYNEFYIISRLNYKNKSQHGPTIHFSIFRKLYSTIKRIDDFELPDLSKNLLKRFYNSQITEKKPKEGGFTHIPEQTYLQYSLLKFTGIYYLFEFALDSTEKTYDSYNKLLKRADFLPTTMAILASVSRINLILKVLKAEVMEVLFILIDISTYYKNPFNIPNKWKIPIFTKEDIEKARESYEI